jgi:hypothetical protein
VEAALKQEILKVVNNDKFNGYFIPRKNIIFGKWIKNDLWHPDYNLRLFKRSKGRLPCKSVHEQPQVEGAVGHLENYLLHYNYQTISQYVNKINNLYSENDRDLLLSENKKVCWPDAIRMPISEFLSVFFARKAYKDGLHGLVLSLLQAFSALVTFAKLWETRGFEEEMPVKFLDKVKREAKKSQKQFFYWLANEKIKSSNNLIKTGFYRIVRKFNS